MRKNLKVAAIVCLLLGVLFAVFSIIEAIGLTGTTAQGTNGAIPEGFVDVGRGAIGGLPLIAILIKAGECVMGFWSGWAGVQAGNVPSKGKASLIANFVACLCFLGASAYFWWIDGGVDTASLLFSLIGALVTLAGVFFSRAVFEEALDQI